MYIVGYLGFLVIFFLTGEVHYLLGTRPVLSYSVSSVSLGFVLSGQSAIQSPGLEAMYSVGELLNLLFFYISCHSDP